MDQKLKNPIVKTKKQVEITVQNINIGSSQILQPIVKMSEKDFLDFDFNS